MPHILINIDSEHSTDVFAVSLFVMFLPKIIYVENESGKGATQILIADRVFLVSIVFSVGALVFLWAMTKMVTERVPYGKVPEKMSYVSTLKSFFTNRPMVGATLASFQLCSIIRRCQ